MGNRFSALPRQRTYNVGYHGPVVKKELDGIATLTYDTLAIENVKGQKLKVADIRIAHISYDKSGKLAIKNQVISK